MRANNRRYSTPLGLILVMVLSLCAPLASAGGTDVADEGSRHVPGNGMTLSLDGFVADTGKPYILFEDDQAVYSATGFLKRAWWEAGSPGAQDSEELQALARSARSCTRIQEGDTSTVPGYGGGTIGVTAERVTQTVAFMVEDGYTLSSTVLSNWASDWDNTIYPILTTYFGKDYGSGPEAPDIDNNCQIEVAIINMDGQYNTGGYFAPSLSSSREIVFVDFADASLGWSKVILAHELQHLLHNAADSQENLWIDEGAADMAAYLCFGASSTLTGHSNAWTQDSGTSIRWWNQRISDYGGGFLFLLWMADHLGGGPAIRQLVENTQTGGAAIQALGQTPPNNVGMILGTTFEEIFANFSIAATLDSSSGIYGLSNVDMTDLCSGTAFCKIQPADSNNDWSQAWDSKGNTIEGWGIQVFKLEPGSSPPAPLTIRLTADAPGMEGRLVSRSSADGQYTVEKLQFNNMVSTAMVPGFGNITDEVHAIVWYGSSIGDCDYTSCGPAYPTAQLDIEAARITSPASLALGSISMYDSENDGNSDTLALPFSVTSNAFFEDLNIEVEAINSNNEVVDTMTTSIEAGGGVPAPGAIYWTPAITDDYTLSLKMKDLLGDTVDEAVTSSQMVYNMQPFPNASVNYNATLTWLPIQFTGSGIDLWGLSDTVGEWPYEDEPVAYLWDFGDGNTSTLRSPLRGYRDEGGYIANLTVQDQGGTWSLSYPTLIGVADVLVPTIKVNDGSGQEVVADEAIELFTNQRIEFSTLKTLDNVPNDNLLFTWDWGDGEIESGIGLTVVSHEWTEGGNGAGNPHVVRITADDGKNIGYFNFTVNVKNRLPRLIFDESLIVDTYTSLPMPNLFVDDDGTLTSINWEFVGGVALNEVDVGRNSDFSMTSSNEWRPLVAWDSPGNKTVQVTVTDDDGGQTLVSINVLVKNQLPVATVKVRDSNSVEVDFRQEDATIDLVYTFDGRDSFDPDGSLADSSILTFAWFFEDGTNSSKTQVSHSFSTPGQHRVTLIVTDEYGESSANRTVVVQVSNPVPVITVQILEAWSSGELVNVETPRSEGFAPDNYSRTFDDADRTHASVGTLLYFDSSGTRDGDANFENKNTPFNTNSSDWNGLVEYIWDFGDGSPPSKESHPWHSYSMPGEYTVSLTVRDAFETGDTTTQIFTIIIDSPPQTDGIMEATEMIIDELSVFYVNASDLEMDRDYDVYRDNNINDGSNSDLDQVISKDIFVTWEIDNTVDENGDEILDNDWDVSSDGPNSLRYSHIYDHTGEVMVKVQVCDGMGICVQEMITIEINEGPEKTPTLSDFNWQDAKAWLSDAGGESAFVLGLIFLVLILGWLVMRTPADLDEEEAAEAAQAYDVQNVEAEGGVLGMDQHEPPPKPKILSKEDRRNSDSGYIRPVRGRRR